METSNNLTSSDEQLNSGERHCDKCHKGFYRPFNPKSAVNHYFKCDSCGQELIIEPNVVVE